MRTHSWGPNIVGPNDIPIELREGLGLKRHKMAHIVVQRDY